MRWQVLRGIMDRKLDEPITHGKQCFDARQKGDREICHRTLKRIAVWSDVTLIS
jgi:hypothetical protein